MIKTPLGEPANTINKNMASFSGSYAFRVRHSLALILFACLWVGKSVFVDCVLLWFLRGIEGRCFESLLSDEERHSEHFCGPQT